MRKKILSGIFALAVMVATGYGVNKSMNNDAGLNELALMNVEALGHNEEVEITCSSSCLYTGVCWESYYNEEYGRNYCRFSGAPNDTCLC